MRVSILVAAASCIASSAAAPAGYAVKETFNAPEGWTKLGRAPAQHGIQLSILLPQSDFAGLEERLYDVSTPSSPSYGQHLTQDEVNAFIKPSARSSELVHDWLVRNGIKSEELSYSPAHDWIHVNLPVEEVESLLNTQYHVFRHEDGAELARTEEWSLPRELHEHIVAVQPTTAFLRGKRSRKIEDIPLPQKQERTVAIPLPQVHEDAALEDSGLSKVCNLSYVSPTCLRTLYGTIDYKAQAADKNGVGLTDYDGSQSNNRSDIKIFLERYRKDAVSAAYKFPITVIHHGYHSQKPVTPQQLKDGYDDEADLDAETILGISYPTPLHAYTTGGKPPFLPVPSSPKDTNEPYLTWLNYVLNQKTVPYVVSTSYEDLEGSVPRSYATAVCNGFAQLGARGVSLTFASGDGGVGCGRKVANGREFQVGFPSNCPYITSVGATHKVNPEVVAYQPSIGYASGGGFGNYFARPKYQDAAVEAYIKGLDGKFDGLYNKSGRGYPDVSAQGQNFGIIYDGKLVPVGGTSASTPAFSAVLALVNDALIAYGKPPMGFLNPWLYSGGYKGFNDITMGSAVGCISTGFPAVKGWDSVSGWGTPNFPKILKELGITTTSY